MSPSTRMTQCVHQLAKKTGLSCPCTVFSHAHIFSRRAKFICESRESINKNRTSTSTRTWTLTENAETAIKSDSRGNPVHRHFLCPISFLWQDSYTRDSNKREQSWHFSFFSCSVLVTDMNKIRRYNFQGCTLLKELGTVLVSFQMFQILLILLAGGFAQTPKHFPISNLRLQLVWLQLKLIQVSRQWKEERKIKQNKKLFFFKKRAKSKVNKHLKRTVAKLSLKFDASRTGETDGSKCVFIWSTSKWTRSFVFFRRNETTWKREQAHQQPKMEPTDGARDLWPACPRPPRERERRSRVYRSYCIELSVWLVTQLRDVPEIGISSKHNWTMNFI